jgi:hypothetical protein
MQPRRSNSALCPRFGSFTPTSEPPLIKSTQKADRNGSALAPESRERVYAMIDFLIGLAYVAIVITPAIVASIQQPRAHSGDL